jgi:NAD-specific glutamate dehydrogenase
MEFDTFMSTSALARVTVELRRDGPVDHDDLTRLTLEIDEMTQRWDDRVRTALVDELGEEEANRLIDQFRIELPAEYTSLTLRARLFSMRSRSIASCTATTRLRLRSLPRRSRRRTSVASASIAATAH